MTKEEVNALKFNMEKMLKAKQLKSWEEVKNHNRDGELCTSTRQKKNLLKVLTKIGDSISTDHSISDQDFQ